MEGPYQSMAHLKKFPLVDIVWYNVTNRLASVVVKRYTHSFLCQYCRYFEATAFTRKLFFPM